MDAKDYFAQFGADEPEPKYDYRAARGILGPSSEPAEVSLRSQRDGGEAAHLRARIAELEAALQEIATANGEESHVLSSLRQMEFFKQGVQAQAERAKKALGMAYKEPMPANILLHVIKRYSAALEWYADKWHYLADVESDMGTLAREALGRE